MARRQQEKSMETHDELRASAVHFFGEKGFNTTTISEITEHAGYAKGNFYRYWKSKDDLFLSIMEEKYRLYRARRVDSLNQASSMDDVIGVIIDFLEQILDDGKWARVFLEFTIHASGNDDVRKELNKSFYRLSSDLFADIVAPHRRDPVYPSKKLGGIVTALFEGFLIQILLGANSIDKEDLRTAIRTLVLHIDNP
ncbi:TetR/AcrR family transcriptional regulator [Desulfoluna spongiiphila]|uniref:Transcriptional regulator, TetR family n=1 Tax=Desulfoluna spongiiphila TaxID=419481 RepID=A0A1G5HUJ1_9BACT|nr:TetR/AcrR family transcriptional regulator [Desulfoluna spongiiphila]SCY66698.1 transcriptional regulator, TetR family [Desulfoluna spongiiphila]VVS91857.1 dna-binding hth domain tetr-type [Desulfoluna spongiiphila]